MSGIFIRRFRRTTLIAVFCAAVLIGIGLSRVLAFESTWALAASGLVLATLRKPRIALLLAVLLAGICIGGVRGSVYMQKLAVNQGFYNTKVTIIGQAAADGVYDQKRQRQLKFEITNVYVAGSPATPLAGTIGVSGFGENVVYRGDTVQVTGKLRPGTGSKQGWMSYAQIRALERDTSVIEKIRKEFGAGMLSALPEPAASFGMGLLLGQNTNLPGEVYDDLLAVGLVHIIAVSGYNLTIILRAGMRLFGNRSKYQTLLFSVSLICTFLLLTGSSASIVRASIVSGLSLAAWYYGRAFRPVTLILLAAFITAMANPLYLWSDLGWYLSFLAFYGVLVLSPQIRYRFVPPRLRENALFGIALESICAEIMTLPLILFIFGQMSHVSLVANVLIASFVPIAMLLAVIAGIAGTFLFGVAGWIAWPAVLVLTYMLDTARILASIPHVFQENIGFGLWAMVAMYGLVVAFNAVLYSRLKRNRAIISLVNEENTLLRTSFSGTPKSAQAV